MAVSVRINAERIYHVPTKNINMKLLIYKENLTNKFLITAISVENHVLLLM